MPQPDRRLDELAWLSRGADLFRRMAALADQRRAAGDTSTADLIDEVLTCEKDPTRQEQP